MVESLLVEQRLDPEAEVLTVAEPVLTVQKTTRATNQKPLAVLGNTFTKKQNKLKTLD